jgi:alpha-glucosidase (family GH31 glycosyl hydrolase)
MLNTSIVGHSWATNDMEVAQKEGIHFGYFLPWSQINSWYYFRMPWLQGKELLSMHQYYARLRSRLVPYLYSWAYGATRSGWPMLVPLTLEFPEDDRCRDNLHQYLLGRDLMVGIYANEIYFPAGQWKDYWTGEVISGLQEKDISWPADRGGALYIRSGAIIPFGPLMQYRSEKPMDEITLYVFPAEKESTFELYEDDGVSFEHLEGRYSITRITTQRSKNASLTVIGDAEGEFNGKVKGRSWNIIMHADRKPASVRYNGDPLPGEMFSWDESRNELTIEGITSPARIMVK